MSEHDSSQILEAAEFLESLTNGEMSEPPSKKSKVNKRKGGKDQPLGEVNKSVDLFGTSIAPPCEYTENNVLVRSVAFGQFSKWIFAIKDIQRKNGAVERHNTVTLVRTYMKDGQEKEFSIRIDAEDILRSLKALKYIVTEYIVNKNYNN